MTTGRIRFFHAVLWCAFWPGSAVLVSGGLTGDAAEQIASVEVERVGEDSSRLRADNDATLPGLLAEYRTLVPGIIPFPLFRLDAKPAFNWGSSSPHPRIPPGPFRVDWTGLLVLKEADAIRFSAFVEGELKFVVDGVEIFNARNTDASRRIEMPTVLTRGPGAYPLKIQYQSLPDTLARIQIWWEGNSFSPAPLPASSLLHVPSELPDGLRAQTRIEEGRESVRQFGCARCHAQAFPSAGAAPPGPSMENLRSRLRSDWLVAWLENPRHLQSHARMPILFAPDRRGFAEISLISDYLMGGADEADAKSKSEAEDHRAGRQAFIGFGCAACHTLPDQNSSMPEDASTAIDVSSDGADRTPFEGLVDRFNSKQLAAFIADPRGRYPDGRMPRLPLDARTARDIAAFLLMWSQPAVLKKNENVPPSANEISAIGESLKLGMDRRVIGAALVKKKGCAACHPGLDQTQVDTNPVRLDELVKSVELGCLSADHLPYFPMSASAREKIAAFASVAAVERHASPFQERQQLLRHSGCFVCHQADGDSPPPIEVIGQTLWTPHLMRLPYQRTPRLTGSVAKYTRSYLVEAIENGVKGIRPSWYSYRMPVFGEKAEQIVQALAERDGEPTQDLPTENRAAQDPTLAMFGATLVGFEGYSCVSCHIWMGRELTSVDPGAVGPELTTVTRRIRREWFDRWLENPARVHPGTPMPAFFPKGQLAPISSVLSGDGRKQKDAIWAYASQGTNAPSPQPRASLPVLLPGSGEPPIVAQIPIRLPDGETMESLCLQYGTHDLVVYDLGKTTLHSVRSGSQILRNPNGWRSFSFSETDSAIILAVTPAFQIFDPNGTPSGEAAEFLGYDRLSDGVKIQFQIPHPAHKVDIEELLREEGHDTDRRLRREWQVTGVPPGYSIRIKAGLAPEESARLSQADISNAIHWTNLQGQARLSFEVNALTILGIPDAKTGSWAGGLTHKLPPPSPSKIAASPAFNISAAVKDFDTEIPETLQRPGYRAFRYPMPKTATGEDRIMPSAFAIDPKTGRLFIASLKLGELFVLQDSTDDVRGATFKDYAGGLFQEAYSMLHDGEALYVLHRRNLTRIADLNGDGLADRFERVAALPHRGGNTYDWAYGLVRDGFGRFIISFAPHADDRNLPGMGGVMRLALDNGQAKFTEIAFGLRNAFGWATGPEGEVFFSDNQGEWVPANKLCHLAENRFYGYPNSARLEISTHPRGETAVWVPYGWAKSINGIAYNASGKKFGPFSDQFFMAELMHGGAIIRANVEKINGVYQGACFPFWGRGLLGPLVLAFDLRGRLFVGAITQPGWMAQPDRGALFRIEFTGATPFEIQSIHVLPAGFRLILTKAVSLESARDPASYSIEHYRYESTGAYGSPELDRTSVQIKQIELAADRQSVDLTTDPLVPGRIYSMTVGGVKALNGEHLLHPTGVYTLNQIPSGARPQTKSGGLE